MKYLILLLSCMTFAQVGYTPSPENIFNPERGFYKFVSTISPSSLQTLKNQSISLVYKGYYYPFDQTIMQADFNALRSKGMKMIIRFAYEEASGCTVCQPNKAAILQHIAELTPILNANSDVIFTMQIGFIGGYGEWYYTNSTEFGNGDYIAYTQTQWNNRKEIVDAILNNTSLLVQLRYPYAKTKMYGSGFVPRLGYFNDAFLNVDGDMGFFVNSTPSATQIQQVIQQTATLPMVGESNGVNSPRTNGANAITELDKYNYTSLNIGYHPDVIQGWKNSGHYATIANRLGYRFILKSGEYSVMANELQYSIQIRNDGFTSTIGDKKVILYLNDVAYEIATNTSTWNSELTLSGTLPIDSLPNGTYKLYIGIENIQFANVGTWANGKNNLFYEFTKSSLGVADFQSIENVPYKVYNLLGQYLGDSMENKSGFIILRYNNGKIKKVYATK